MAALDTRAASQGANQGEFVLEISRPTVNTEAHDHGGRGPNRNDATRAAVPIASTASATTPPAGDTGPKLGSKRCAHTMK